jgi:hypothetical protein
MNKTPQLKSFTLLAQEPMRSSGTTANDWHYNRVIEGWGLGIDLDGYC